MFELNQLLSKLEQLADNQHFWIAYSGGLDSHVLLHALSELRQQRPGIKLAAIHIHHGLSPQAHYWLSHCQQICMQLNIDFYSQKIKIHRTAGESIEALAREARYQVFAELLPANAYLLTAHTQDDQAETLLLQLLRGAGPKGLASMPVKQSFAQGHLLRALLDVSREQLKNYALAQQLNWIEDESNQDLRFDRNFIRHQVLPVLHQRWPTVRSQFAKAANHCAQADLLLSQLAENDFQQCDDPQFHRLNLLKLNELSKERVHNVLRYWFQVNHCRMPSTQQLNILLQEIIYAKQDASPILKIANKVIRRYQNHLYLLANNSLATITQPIFWDLQTPLILPAGLGELSVEPAHSKGLSLSLNKELWNIRFRQGGERIRLIGQTHHRELKKLFQQWKIPPWERQSIPLLFYGDQLACVIGYGISSAFVAKENETGVQIIHRYSSLPHEFGGRIGWGISFLKNQSKKFFHLTLLNLIFFHLDLCYRLVFFLQNF